MQSRLTALGLAVLVLALSRLPLEAQRRPLAPSVSEGEHLHPFFEGWYPEEDGSRTFSFGYYNRNTGGEPMYIPLGEDNFVEPAEFDGEQPTWFEARRERGVFTVTVPPDWPEDQPVVWTLRNSGGTYSVPATWRSPSYELSYIPMAMGSLPPVIRMDPEGEVVQGITTRHWGEPKSVRVGEPLELTVWARDNMAPSTRDSVDVSVAWYTHTGPSEAVFARVPSDEPEAEAEPAGGRGRGRGPPPPNEVDVPLDSEGNGSVLATFNEPGEYVLRVVATNFGAPDSSSGDQCCWTQGFVQVTAMP
jgi:hypothetical protein